MRRVERRALLEALEQGDFYASTGVELTEYEANERRISVTVKPTAFSKYRIQFIGKGGRLLREVTEPAATYEIRGDERYVRARIVESNGRLAWCQPVMISRQSPARGAHAGLWLIVALSVAACRWKVAT